MIDEAARLETLWRGPFGAAYTERNAQANQDRESFWRAILGMCHPTSVLEVGCNIGRNIEGIRRLTPAVVAVGLDVNEGALQRVGSAYRVVAVARRLPFVNARFDLVFTMGVLIHQPPEALHGVMAEIVRCSRRWVLAAEYAADALTVVPYRGEERALFKDDYGQRYVDWFPWLRLCHTGAVGWGDVTYWLLEKA